MLTAAVWIAVLAAVAPLGIRLHTVERNAASDQLPARAESTRADEAAATLPGGDTYQFIVVYHRTGGLTDADRAVVASHQSTLSARFAETGAGRADPGARPVVSADGTAELFPLTVAHTRGEARDVLADVRGAVADRPPGLDADVTGPAGLAGDLSGVFKGIDYKLLVGPWRWSPSCWC